MRKTRLAAVLALCVLCLAVVAGVTMSSPASAQDAGCDDAGAAQYQYLDCDETTVTIVPDPGQRPSPGQPPDGTPPVVGESDAASTATAGVGPTGAVLPDTGGAPLVAPGIGVVLLVAGGLVARRIAG